MAGLKGFKIQGDTAAAAAATVALSVAAVAAHVDGRAPAAAIATAAVAAVVETSMVCWAVRPRWFRGVVVNRVVGSAAAYATLATAGAGQARQGFSAGAAATVAACVGALADENTGTATATAATVIAAFATVAVGVAAAAPFALVALVDDAVIVAAFNIVRSRELRAAPAKADEQWFPVRARMVAKWEARRSAAVVVTRAAWLVWAARGVSVGNVAAMAAMQLCVLGGVHVTTTAVMGAKHVPLDPEALHRSLALDPVEQN